MRRDQLEHLIRAAGSVTGAPTLHIVGSQAILATTTSGPRELFLSREADMFVDGNPELSDLIDGTLGEFSPFDQTFGYYAHGIDESTAILPKGWRSRLVPIKNENTLGVTGLCLDPNDLALSKMVASREKDALFVAALRKSGVISISELETRARAMPLSLRRIDSLLESLNRL